MGRWKETKTCVGRMRIEKECDKIKEEVREIIRKMKRSKAAGNDGIPNEA